MLTKSEIRELLQKLVYNRTLTQEELYKLLDEAYEQSHDVLFTAILIWAKDIDSKNIVSTVKWLQKNMVEIQNAPANAIDICGTGGDQFDTFNISTASAFVIAEAGVPVIKNGGRSNRERAGSSDVLKALNMQLCKNPASCDVALKNSNIAFLDAPSFHPALSTFRLIRVKLGIPTILNIAAAISNPARITRQVIGVYSRNLVKNVADALCKMYNTKHALVVYGDGIDEITNCGITLVAEIKINSVTHYRIEPEMFELHTTTIKEIRGGSTRYNAEIIKDALSGVYGPCADVIALNAGAGIYVSGLTKTLRDGVFMAKEIIASGRGLKKLKQAQSVLKQ